VLVRNHEGSAGPAYVANRPDITYGPAGVLSGAGGTTNLIFDTQRGRVDQRRQRRRRAGLRVRPARRDGEGDLAMNNINLASDCNDVVGAGGDRQSEWAGACSSPDGRWLFANIQTPGVTFAITGPWGNGPLEGRGYGRRGPSGENRTVACGPVCTVS
jgi:hypothetical protein